MMFKQMNSFSRPRRIKIGESLYFNASHLKEYDPVYFVGTSRSVRAIVKRKSIPLDQVLYAGYSKRFGWRPASNQLKPYSKANLLLSAEWVYSNIPKMKSTTSIESTGYEYPPAPPMLYLADSEKFQSDSGKIVEIETRGTRDENGVYFLASDAAIAFEMENLIEVICKSHNYIKGSDYKIFTRYKLTLSMTGPSKKNIKTPTHNRRIFLTYEGMIKILYSSRSKIAKTFRTWATKTLFTIQMGTSESKTELVSSVLGIPAKSLKEVLKTSAQSVPCIYLFSLGTMGGLRKSMKLDENIPNDFIIVKYGLTEDLARRTGEHLNTYEKKIKNAKLELMQYVYIDPKYLHEAETSIKDFFTDIEMKVEYMTFNELIAINPKHLRQIKNQYRLLHVEFSGCVKDLTESLNKARVDAKITEERHQWELKDKDRIIEQRDLIIAGKDKDNEILRLRLELQKNSKHVE